MLNPRLAASCEEVMKRSSASFYEAFRLLSSPRREAVFVIYAFCRMIDDSVDEPDKADYSLDELEALFGNLDEAEGHFIWPSLRWLMASFPLAKEPFLTQMSGQRLDRVQTHYDSLDQLEDYCYRVAGSVGEMLLPVLHESPDRDIVEAGIWLGKGMQIVNIIRDVGEDRGLGRRYIPLELMRRCGYSEEMFEAGEVDAAFRRLLGELAGTAREWFGRGLAHLSSYPQESAFAIRLAAHYYFAILHAVEENGYDVYGKRAYVSDEAKKTIFRAVMADMAEAEREAADPGEGFTAEEEAGMQPSSPERLAQ
ncbi:phytoene/squalene synthase family protein [Paenibacillus sp. D9]|nr:phytoene/squalene synthase family protein [Paenibacillus sp. D9]